MLGFIYGGIPLIHAKVSRLILRHKVVKSKAVALTFDDGPGNLLTPEIMKILNENNAKASFFLLGRSIEGREEIVTELAKSEQEICSHGYEHLHYLKVSPFRALKDIKRGWEAIDNALGCKQRKYPFRPPYGKLNIVCLLYLFFHHVPVVYWLADSGDTWQSMPDCQRGADIAKEAGGTVFLAHDFDRHDLSRNQHVLESTRLILTAAKVSGMKCMTVSELLNAT